MYRFNFTPNITDIQTWYKDESHKWQCLLTKYGFFKFCFSWKVQIQVHGTAESLVWRDLHWKHDESSHFNSH